MMDRPTVATIIPAFNEARTIGNVLRAVRTAAGISEIVVVDDGSEDNTALIARGEGTKVIILDKNMGKAAALLEGIRCTDADTLLLMDADVIGLTAGHIERLLEPVLSRRADMAVGVFSEDMIHRTMSFLSGLRVVPRGLICSIPDLYDAGFGIETLISRHAKANGHRIEEVLLDNVTHLTKGEKFGPGRSLSNKCRALWDIVRSGLKRL
ncbi:MAG: glycosyltransferase family 2 protein [bacterium]|nr:glycosyltransferase family 2 protein [bacterium]